MEQRGNPSSNDRLVCVFLRVLEYFDGLMFLTTNIVKKIDQAIWSRIDYIKEYKSLSPRNQAQLWKTFLRKVDSQIGYECSDEQIDSLATKNLNGREVSKEWLTKYCRLT